MSTKRTISLDPSWFHHFVLTALACATIAGLARFVFTGQDDPMRCNSLLSSGSWLDDVYRNWQPDGCMLYSYQSKDASPCLSSRRVVFVGDSVTRALFFQFVHIVDPSLPKEPPDDGAKHSDHSFLTGSHTILDFIWDPFLNTTAALALINPPKAYSTEQSGRPALLVLGSGLWYLRYADISGGLSAWEANIEAHIEAINGAHVKPADEVVFLPVEEVVSSKLSFERLNTMHSSDIDAMNSDLHHRIKPSTNTSWSQLVESTFSRRILLPSVFNKMLDDSQTQDGLHFSEVIVKAQANILLNLLCNDKWPPTFPMDKTCCRMYPWPGPVQLVVLGSLILYSCTLIYSFRTKTWAVKKEYLPAIIFSASISIIFLADRTGLWLKEQKQFNPWTFCFLCSMSLVIGLATIRRADKDLGFLNRDQTDEWKGWMQIMILIYHYLGASKISGIYNPIRVLVAAYLFMTGYGHTTFYLKRADFSCLRVVQILVRLNLLTLTLAYTMNTNYLSYYFAPLVSMWFLVIYLTLWIGSQLNNSTLFLAAKISLSMGTFAAFTNQKWLMDGFFEVLERIFFIHWSAREWIFRVSLDQYIVYCGMFTALVAIKIRDKRFTEHPAWPMFIRSSIGMSVMVLIWFMCFELLQENKFTYNTWHPYISFLPVLAFMVLRNATPLLRSSSSRAFAFIGKCSLETFIIQYHLWLAADTKGILLLIPGTKWRAVNFVLTTTIFVYVSHQVAWATGEMTNWICDEEKNTLPVTRDMPSAKISNAVGPHGGVAPSATGSTNNHCTESDRETEGHSQRPQRWVDRLAEGTHSRQSSVFSIVWSGILLWRPGAKGRIMVWAGLMWLANALWTNKQ